MLKSWDKELTRAYERFNVRIEVELLLTLRIPLTSYIDQRPPRHSGPYRGLLHWSSLTYDSRTEIILEERSTSRDFKLDADKGWISRRGADGIWRRICWLPHKRRQNGMIASFGQKVCVCALRRLVTILDFSDVKNESIPYKSAL
jgi:hypothetical protein